MNSQLPPPNDIIIYSEAVNEFIGKITQNERESFSTIVNIVKHDYMFLSKFFKWFDEYQPNCHNEQHYKTVILLNYYYDMKTLYRKSIYHKLLESKDPTIIALFRNTTLNSSLYKQNLNECSLPLSLLLDASEYANITYNWYIMAFTFINQIYFPDGSSVNRQEIERNFINRGDLIRKEKFSLQTIREVIQVFLKGVFMDISEISVMLVFYLCFLTFQNLTKEDIFELKDDYIRLIPFIYQYSASSRLSYYSMDNLFIYGYDKRERSQPNYLHYLIHYYGIEIIEKESLNFYWSWKSKPKKQRNNITLFTFAEYMIESSFIKDHLQELYDYFWDATPFIDTKYYVYFLSVWGLYIERYGIVQPKHFNNLIVFLSDSCKIVNKEHNSQNLTLYEFYTTLLASNPEYTISNFKDIVTIFTNKPRNFIVYLNQLILKPSIIHSIKTNKNSAKLYDYIKRVGSRSPEDYCYLLEFFMAYEKVSEYTKMIPKFIGAINSNKKWLVRDESFFDTILRFYSIIKRKNPKEAKQLFEKTIRSFIKTLESDNKSSMVKFDVIYPYLSDIKEINYLLKQTKELLNDSDQFVEIFKHFIDLDQIGQNFIQENLDSMIDMEVKSTNKNDILVLEYLNDSTLTGFTFNHNKIEQNLNNQTPHIQNLIIQKFVGYITRDKSTKPSDILSLSLVSKLFFKSVCLTFQHYKIQLNQRIPDKYQLSRRKWSFMSFGCYHINYKDLERFHYQDVEDIFYQLSSLTIHKPMIYLVNREMSNLTHLDIETANDMSLSCILQMMNHCFKLQSVKFSFFFELNSNRISQIDAIFQKLILNNSSTLAKLYFGYPATYISECIESIESIIGHIINHQISYPTTFKYQIALTLNDDYVRDNLPNLDRIVSLTSSCTHLILENYNKIKYQLKPNLFLNLQSIFIQVIFVGKFYREVIDFIMSPEIKLESLTIFGHHDNLREMELIKKSNLKKVNFIIYEQEQVPEKYIDSILSDVNQNQSIKSLKVFKGFRDSINIPTLCYYPYIDKIPCTTDVHQLNLGEFHSINTNHFIKY
ncbi:hypothetical protein DLAC_10509 [Tieghemostelium lacteum]|uniref:Uncharacterized protein n=1 Tax=Tieghemostelium lacteum TaxID=361077 RepID=A0A151Z4T0_TIELA|nr:hypothetical protein DLAC_10509 [Tieghemostelium lacteum]|eukprot:KYQ88927.1 hypothetical protein DLAC_10509 [Tieghemostelium lacteum]